MAIDSHCHLDAPEFDADRAEVVARAVAAGIDTLIVPGVGLEDAEKPPLLFPKLEIYKAVGLHPYFDDPPDAMDRLERVLQKGQCIAVGEIGIDRRHPVPLSLFTSQLDLAIAYRLPVILHVVHAHEEVLEQLHKRPQLTGVVHAFSGSWELAKRYLSLGFKLGWGGLVTRPEARKLHTTVVACPADAYLLETDAPDQPIEAKRGQRHEPADLMEIARTVSRLRGCSVEDIIATSDANIRKLFLLLKEGSGVWARR